MSFEVSQVGDFSTEGPSRLTSLSIVGSTGLLVKSSEEGDDPSSLSAAGGSTKSTLLAGVTLNERPCIAVFELAWKKIAAECQPESGGSSGSGGSSSIGKSNGKIGGGGGTTKKVLPAPIVLNQGSSVGFVSLNECIHQS